ncbi:hypothetical protein G4Y79_23545 [Phototrophicus methaneseepsis]|uniref:Transcriptional regulator n=1 Tax=Phototrophicus methaneseepsis TaxID=2710758 RepID=A0A7S8E928_9CHLR|nr:hypothetical protein [Phototrophicus methaneseepsis]QPC82627.1 hypothetical protein G4Y79_23545 [Phototrophicus methaneseepsis]
MLDDPTSSSYFAEGREHFGKAHSRAFFSQFLDLLRGKSLELLSFDDVKDMLDLRQQSYRGLQDVPLDRIVGSVGRSKDFTRRFLPKNSNMSERWSRIYALFHSLEGPPPIECYLVDDVYFVRDGNHRVSVARQLGFKTIQAYVTELATPIDIEPDMTQAQWDAATAYAHFLHMTELSETRPQQVPITVTEPGGYQIMLEHIRLLHRVRNHCDKVDLSFSEAAAEWYDNVYRPAITLIRKYHVLDGKSGTEADLYLWMMEHLRQLHEEYEDGPPQRLSDALVDYLTSKKIPIPKGLMLENDAQPPLG